MVKTTPVEQPIDKEKRKITFESFACFLLAWFIARQLGLMDLLPFARGDWGTWLGIVGLVVALSFKRILPLLRGLVVMLCGLWLMVAFSPLPNFLIQPLKVDQQPQRADAIVVLQAGIQKDNDFMSGTLERTLHGLELVHEGYAPRLILTEDGRIEGSHQKAATQLMKNLGIKGSIVAVGPVQNTHDEAVLVSTLARKLGWTKILLVTSPTHSKRADLLFRKIGLQVISSPCRETEFDFENLNESDPDGRMKAFGAAMREIVGIKIYRMRGWI